MHDLSSSDINNLVDNLIENKITMVNKREFQTVINHYNNIDKIEGDIIECGCWRGGFSIFLSYLFPDRNIWVSDSFEGFQPTNDAKYGYDMERHTPNFTHNSVGALAVSLEDVQNNFNLYALGNEERIKFLKGFVKDTLPTAPINKIALLRIDVDAFSATLEVLDELYDKVETGGYIIFDDSCLYETRDAIKEFFNKRNLPLVVLHPVSNEELSLEKRHTSDDSGLPCGCFIIKK